MTAPDRIWADAPSIFDGMDLWHETQNGAAEDATEYVRADIHAALTAELAAAGDAALVQDQQLKDTEAALDSYRAATDATEAALARVKAAMAAMANTINIEDSDYDMAIKFLDGIVSSVKRQVRAALKENGK